MGFPVVSFYFPIELRAGGGDRACPFSGCSIFKIVDATSSQPGDLALASASARQSADASSPPVLPANLIQDLWVTAKAEDLGLTPDEFGIALCSAGAKFNFGLPSGTHPDAAQRAAFFHTLHLGEFALARACALGREPAWQRFLSTYRAALTQAAVAITGSASLGYDLADSLYADLYGLRELEGERRSPLASYSGRGSLLGWLRTTLAQRYVDHHRRARRETALDDIDMPNSEQAAAPVPAEITHLTHAVASTLHALVSEDRFLLSAYFLDRRTLLQIARLLRVHEATISRRLKRLVNDVRKQLIRSLQSAGLSKEKAEETLGSDPRDIEINLRNLLQTSQGPPFSDQTAGQR